MRSFRHWTPRYILCRTLDILYRRRHPDHPWLTPQAISILESWLMPDDKGIEWGSGRSTIWFAARVGHLVSVEHDPVWYEKVQQQLIRGGADNVDHRLLSLQEGNGRCPYAEIADDYPDQFFDFALVDGRVRHICMERVIPKLRIGGMLILDNSERYLPHDAAGTYFERGGHIRAAAESWERLLKVLKGWRTIGTTNGLWSTHLWIKSC